jgi:hypothetical protein
MGISECGPARTARWCSSTTRRSCSRRSARRLGRIWSSSMPAGWPRRPRRSTCRSCCRRWGSKTASSARRNPRSSPSCPTSSRSTRWSRRDLQGRRRDRHGDLLARPDRRVGGGDVAVGLRRSLAAGRGRRGHAGTQRQPEGDDPRLRGRVSVGIVASALKLAGGPTTQAYAEPLMTELDSERRAV